MAASGVLKVLFAKIPGVTEVLPGYIGDEAYNANYEAVSTGMTKALRSYRNSL